MELTQDNIKLIVRLVTEGLGPNAGIDEIKNLASEIIDRIQSNSAKTINADTQKTLIINAFGPKSNGLENKIRDYLALKSLSIAELSSTTISDFNSIIVLVDYSGFGGDINILKFELSNICTGLGFKAIIQDSNYYNV